MKLSDESEKIIMDLGKQLTNRELKVMLQEILTQLETGKTPADKNVRLYDSKISLR